MKKSHRQRDGWFDTWLDARVAGKSPPAADATSLSEGELEEFQHATDAAVQFHELAKRRVGGFDESSEMHAVWEKVMSQQSAHPLDPSFGAHPVSLRDRGERRVMWSAAISAAVAAALLIGIVSGFQWFGGEPGNGSGVDQIQFGASGSATPTVAAVVAAVDEEESDEFVIVLTDCTTDPLTKQQVLDAMASDPDSMSQRAIQTISPEDPSLTSERRDQLPGPDALDEMIETSQQFFACMAQGMPMSSLALTNTAFKRDWILGQLGIGNGWISDDAVEVFVDDLVAQQEAAERNPIESQSGGNVFLPSFRSDNYLITLDLRVHVIVSWISDSGQSDMAEYLKFPPDNVTFDKSDTGDWQIDRISFDTYGG